MSVANNINIAKVCVSLTIRAIEQGLEKDLLLPRKLYCSYQVVNDINSDNPSSADLTLMSNQLYSMCGGYAFEAQRILNLGGGGIVATTPAGGGLTPYPIAVSLVGGQIVGMTIKAVVQSDWYGLSGFSFCFINQNQLSLGTNFTYNSVNGVFDLSLYSYTPQVGDIFSVQAFKSV